MSEGYRTGGPPARGHGLRERARDMVNRLTHRCYTERVEAALRTSGLHPYLYAPYKRLLAALHPEPTHPVRIGDATAEFHTQHASEIVSIHHTLTKEDRMLRDLLWELRPDDTVWDIGANLGVYTCLSADRLDGGRVHAYEPHPDTAARLRENVDLSGVPAGTVAVHELALGDENTATTLRIDRDEVGTQTPRVGRADGAELDVTQRRGDSLPATHADPDIIKIDVEGLEPGVLAGLEGIFERGECRAVFCEAHGKGTGIAHMLGGYGFPAKVVPRRSQNYVRAVREGVADGD